MYIVISKTKQDDQGRDVGINPDGSTSGINEAYMYSEKSEAAKIAQKFGGVIWDEEDLFPQDFEDEEDY